MTDGFLLSEAAMRCVPMVAVNVVASVYLLRVWQRTPPLRRKHLAALPLCLYFTTLASLALSQCMMTSFTSLRVSLYWENIGQAVSAILSVPPLFAFALRYLALPPENHETLERRKKLALTVVTLLAIVASIAFVVDSVRAEHIHYDFDYTHARKRPEDEVLYDILVTSFVATGYTASLLLLVHRAWRAPPPVRRRVALFSVVVVAAVFAIFVNRFEVMGVAPIGSYASYIVWITLGAIVLFMGSTDEITSFRERTVSLVLVVALALFATISQQALNNVQSEQAATRRLLTPLVHDGIDVGGGVAALGPARIEGDDPRVARIIEVVDGKAASFPYVVERRAIHEAAQPLVLLLLLSVVAILTLIPPLAQWSVLGPLAALTRAEEQNRAKSMFLAQMSHELKTPLHAILFHARALLKETTSEEERLRRTSSIEGSADHLSALINNLLASGRGALHSVTPRPSPVELRRFVDKVVFGHRAIAEAKGITLSVHAATDVPTHAVFDESLLRQVIDNFVSNALKYSDGGAVRVALTRRESRLSFSVEDDGRGIPVALQEKIFEPFFQHEPRGGVGLGLSIARDVVALCAGTLRLHSTPGRGTSISVEIPYEPTASPPVPSQELLHPPNDDLVELLALARVGDVVAIGTRARARVETCAPDFKPFYEKIVELSAQYQVRTLQRLLSDDAEGRGPTHGA